MEAKKYYFSLILLFFTAIFNAQHVINGVAYDNSGNIVQNAEIVLQNNSFTKTTKSDNLGTYFFENISPGSYNLKINSQSYTSEYSISVRNEDLYYDLVIEGLTTEGQLEDIVIDVQSTKDRIETSGFAVNVIDTKEASLRNLQTNELLDRTVGVRVRQNGGIGSSVEYNLNGMTGRSIGIFIDGIEISTYGSSFNLNNIPPAMIERIEVYKGVLPTHLSGDFLGGAINVILKKGINRRSLVADVSYGSFNTFQSNLGAMYRNNKNGFSVRASGFYTYSDNDYEVWGRFVRNVNPDGTMTNIRARRFHDAFKTYGTRIEAGFTDVKWADNFMIGYNGSYAYNEIQHGQYMSRPYMGRFTESRANVLSLNYTKNHLFTEGLNLIVNAVYSDRTQYVQDTVRWNYNWDGTRQLDLHGRPIRTPEGAQQGAPTMNTISRKILTLRSNLGYMVAPNHKISFNHIYYTVDRNDNDALRSVMEQMYVAQNDLNKHVFALAYEAQFFNNKLKSNLFAKHYQQKIDRIEPVIQQIDGQDVLIHDVTTSTIGKNGYGLALSYNIIPRLILLGSTEAAVRMPAESEIFGGPADNIIANPTLEPEVSNNYNLGFRADVIQNTQHKLVLTANGFIRNVKDRIMRQSETRNVNQDVETMPFVNIGRAQSLGFEGELSYFYGKNLNAMISMSKFNSLYKDPQGNSVFHNQQLPNEPFFTINGNIQYRVNHLIQKQSSVNFYYTFGYVHPFNTIWMTNTLGDFYTPKQYIHDVGFSYMFPNKKFLLSFDAKNIANNELYDNFGVQKPGRSFFLKINYTLNNF